MNDFVDVAAKYRREMHALHCVECIDCGPACNMTHCSASHHVASPASAWARQDAQHAAWAFLFIGSYEAQQAVPLKFSGDGMYLSTETITMNSSHPLDSTNIGNFNFTNENALN